jgi:hypothetical protein
MATLSLPRAFGQEVESAPGHLEDRRMTDVVDERVWECPIDLEHVRRARRVLDLLVLRFGVSHFLETRADAQGRERRARGGRLSPAACDDAISLARNWIERRTGRPVTESVIRMMRRDLRTMLARRIREGAACVR